MSVEKPTALGKLVHWVLEPVLVGCLVVGLVAVHMGMYIEPAAMREAVAGFHSLAFHVALALSAWRICVRPALDNLYAAARNLDRDGDE